MFSVLLMLALIACDRDANNSATENNPSNSQTQNNTEKPPEFNYIPINDPDKVCQDVNAASETLEGLLQAPQITSVATHFEVCGQNMVSACAPCSPEENPALALLDAPITLPMEVMRPPTCAAGEENVSCCKEDEETFACLFRRALGFPYRDLVVTHEPGAVGFVTLSQARKLACAPDATDCQESYELQPESLRASCDEFGVQMASSSVEEGDRSQVSALPDLLNSQPFGFFVPLVLEIPDLDRFGSDAEVQVWMALQQSMRVFMQFPEVSLDVESATGAGCGRMRGYVDRCVFQAVIPELSVLDAYVSQTPPGYVPSLCEVDENGEPAPARMIEFVLAFELEDLPVSAPEAISMNGGE